MRNILLALVLANVLYFLWGMFQDDEPEPGVAILNEADLGPALVTTEPEVEVDSEEAPEDAEAAVADSDAPAVAEETQEEEPVIELAAAVGRSCVTLGPFRSSEDSDGAESQYQSEGMTTASRMETGQIFVGHWVQIRNIANKAEGDQTVAALRDGGIPEAYLVTTDDEGLKISLGVFGNRDGAERVEAQAKAKGYAAEITPRMADGVYYFVDVVLPPGRGAGAMVERYGEEKVRMREVSSCPD